MNKIKRISVYLVTLVLFMLILISGDNEVSAATVTDSMSDNTSGTANAINMGDTISGSITETDDLDYYRFTLDSAGCVTLDMTSYMQYYCIILYDSNGEKIWYTDNNGYNNNVGYRKDVYNVYLEKGTYSMQVNGYRYGTWDKSTGKYECHTSFVSSGVNNSESDNSVATANLINLGSTIIGQISQNDDYDMYKYVLPEDGCVTLNMTSYMQYYCIIIYDSNGEKIWYTDNNGYNSNVGYRCDTYNVYLEKGIYYMQVNGYRYETWDKSTGKYAVSTNYTLSGVSFNVDNNSFASANPIMWNTTYTGQISVNDDFDTYRCEVLSDKTLAISITSYMQYYCVKIFDVKGKIIWNTDRNGWNGNVGYRKDIHNVVLSAGTYYIQVNGYRYETWDKSTGKYVFSINELNQSNCVHEYVDRIIAPTYLKKGYVLHKCKKCGKTYKDKYTDKKMLGTVLLYSCYSAGKGKIVSQWNTITDASGYQIRYYTNKSMKKSVKTKLIKGQGKIKCTIKHLSRNKKYYVQVRAYKKVGKKVVYGKWSEKRKIKVR